MKPKGDNQHIYLFDTLIADRSRKVTASVKWNVDGWRSEHFPFANNFSIDKEIIIIRWRKRKIKTRKKNYYKCESKPNAANAEELHERQCNAPENAIHSKSFSLKTHFGRNTRTHRVSDAIFAWTFSSNLSLSLFFFSTVTRYVPRWFYILQRTKIRRRPTEEME